jgi:RNA polymerase sigma-70 factor (ECF subfamily)
MRAASDLYSSRTDAELVHMARENNRDAYGELVRRYRAGCLRFASSLLRDRGEAEEEVQNALWRAYEHLDQLREVAEFSGWLLRIVANHCLMRLRSRSRARMLYLDGENVREGESQIEVPCCAYDPEYELIQSQMAGVVQEEIRRIPKLFRNVVLLRDVERLSMSDVAQRLGITIPAAKSRLFRARTELRHRILQSCGSCGHYISRSRVQELPARSTRCPIAQA